MPSVRKIATGVVGNWSSVAVTVLIAFFLTPFVVHSLGDTAYGVWIIIGSVVSYMALLDLGLRGAVIHYVAKSHAVGDHADASRAFSGALWTRMILSLGAGIASLILAALLPRFFQIPGDLAAAARIAVLLTGLGMAVTLTCGIFGGVLAALHRYDLISVASIAQSLLVTALTVWVLRSGYGILALAAAQLGSTLVGNAALVWLCRRVYPQLRISLRWPDRDVFAKLWSYSIYVFLINVGAQIIYFTDNIVVGAMISAEAVTLYAIGGRLIEYHRQIAAGLGQALMPVFSNLHAEGRNNDMRRLLVQAMRLGLILNWPVELVLFFRGETFIRLWMGAHYAPPSARILQILLISNFVLVGNSISGNLAYGMGKHKPFALWVIIEAVVNLGLSVWLASRIGFTGVAWGTTLPSLITQGILWPVYVCRLVDLNLASYIWQVWVRTALALTPFAIACLYTDRYWPASNVWYFFLQVAAVLPLVPLGVVACYRRELMEQIRDKDSYLRRNLLARWIGPAQA